jgi:hypothetical protein
MTDAREEAGMETTHNKSARPHRRTSAAGET